MKLTKTQLKQIIKEELNEFTLSLNPATGKYELECAEKPLEERPEDW